MSLDAAWKAKFKRERERSRMFERTFTQVNLLRVSESELLAAESQRADAAEREVRLWLSERDAARKRADEEHDRALRLEAALREIVELSSHRINCSDFICDMGCPVRVARVALDSGAVKGDLSPARMAEPSTHVAKWTRCKRCGYSHRDGETCGFCTRVKSLPMPEMLGCSYCGGMLVARDADAHRETCKPPSADRMAEPNTKACSHAWITAEGFRKCFNCGREEPISPAEPRDK